MWGSFCEKGQDVVVKYEYNGHLLEEERIEKVALEIVEKYPHVSMDQARDAARLEGRISTEKDALMQFDRLYNIMLIMEDDRRGMLPVYNDLVEVLKNNSEDENAERYFKLALGIQDYLKNNGEFPFPDFI